MRKRRNTCYLSPRELAVSTVLHEHWNPIGCDVPEDEYDSYAPFVTALLRETSQDNADERGEKARVIASFLGWARHEMMGLRGGTDAVDAATATALLSRQAALLALPNERPGA